MTSAELVKNTVNGLLNTTYVADVKEIVLPVNEVPIGSPAKQPETQFEKEICNVALYCFQCRNEKQFRDHMVQRKFVTEVDYTCVFRNLPFNVELSQCPKETREFVARNEKMQQYREKAPSAIRSLRRGLRGQVELLQYMDILEYTLFPGGIPAKCVHQTVTDEKIKAEGCGCKANVINCASVDVDKSKPLTTRDCTRQKCRFFTEETL